METDPDEVPFIDKTIKTGCHWQTVQKSRNVFALHVPWDYGQSWEQWFLLCSDRHWDNPHSDREMQARHLKEAVKRNAGIIDVGDFFCFMQGNYDPRKQKNDIRPEHNVDDYIDTVIEDAAEWFAPYAKHFVFVGMGNHEKHILKRLETNPTERLCQALHMKTGYKVFNGQYGGWVKFLFKRVSKSSSSVMRSASINLKYHHGYGGGGPVTKGVIQTNRRASFIDADIHVSGHIHEQWQLRTIRESLSERCELLKKDVYHVCLGTYKQDYADGADSWEANRGQPPKPKGAWWLRFYTKKERDKDRIAYQFILAD